ncbi:MAG: DUF58 domain-containing protein [Planctomycetes bacterium]|nr:DUF58 domain-containing protein [Planctomycetota bacterium]
MLALGALALIAGLVHRNSAAIAFSAPLLFAPSLAFWILRWTLRRIQVEREAPAAAFEGDEVEVKFKIRNHSPLPVFFPAVNDLFTPEIHEPKTVSFPQRVRAGEEVEDGYRGTCLLPRGLHAIGPGVLSLSDPFGWTQIERPLPPSRPMKVYPRLLRFGPPDKRGDAVSALRDEKTLLGRGESLEFFSVREYQPGDPLRRVHWPLTAHRGFPVVREFLRHAVGSLTLFFDLYRPALVGIGRGSSLEHTVKILVAFAHHATLRGHRVQAFALGKEALIVPYGTGKAQLERILDLAVQVKPDGDVPLPQLLSIHQHRLQRGDSVVLPLSPYLFQSPELFEHLRGLRRRGLRVLAIVFDETTFRPLWHGAASSEGKTEEFLSRLRSLGTEAYVVACGAELELIFKDRGGS